jgi:hypothetical protein
MTQKCKGFKLAAVVPEGYVSFFFKGDTIAVNPNAIPLVLRDGKWKELTQVFEVMDGI